MKVRVRRAVKEGCRYRRRRRQRLPRCRSGHQRPLVSPCPQRPARQGRRASPEACHGPPEGLRVSSSVYRARLARCAARAPDPCTRPSDRKAHFASAARERGFGGSKNRSRMSKLRHRISRTSFILCRRGLHARIRIRDPIIFTIAGVRSGNSSARNSLALECSECDTRGGK